jgi:hypothetical protein
LGLIVIEIKSVTIDQIVAIAGHRWEFQNYYTTTATLTSKRKISCLPYWDTAIANRPSAAKSVVVP